MFIIYLFETIVSKRFHLNINILYDISRGFNYPVGYRKFVLLLQQVSLITNVVILQVSVSKTRSRVFSGRVSCKDVSLSFQKPLVLHPILPDHRGTPLFDYQKDNQKGLKKVFTVYKLGILACYNNKTDFLYPFG